MAVDGINIVVCFSKEHFDYAYDRFYFKEDKLIEPNMACEFIEQSIYGDINSEKLNNQRINELNTMDMMQNANIFYHQEIIIE